MKFSDVYATIALVVAIISVIGNIIISRKMMNK